MLHAGAVILERHALAPRATCRYFFCLAVVVAAAEVVDEHLLDGLVVGDEDVADGVSADEVANFFGEILGVIAGAFQRLGHEDDLQAGLADEGFPGFSMWRRKMRLRRRSISASARRTSMALPISRSEKASPQSVSIFSSMVAIWVRSRVSSESMRPLDREGAIGEAEQQVSDALEADHELHAGEKFAGFGGFDFGDGGCDAAVDFHVEGVEFALALAQGIEQGGRAGGDAFGRGSSGLFRHVAGFHRATHDVLMSRFGSRELLIAVLISDVRRARMRATRRSGGTIVTTLPFLGWDRQQLSIRFFVHAAVNKV